MPASSVSDKTALRRELRQRRRALTVFAQRRAARALAQQLAALPALRQARHLALYWPNDGEIDPRLLRDQPALRHCHFYLPVLRAFPTGTLVFAHWPRGARLARNRFGIPEPRGGVTKTADALDVMLLPLTGFDADGRRLGMGGGFYDRTLAFLLRLPRPRPLLVGVAHACQQVPQLPAEAWDVPVSAIVTDGEVIRSR